MLLKGLYHNFYLRIAVFILLTIAGTYLVLQQEWAVSYTHLTLPTICSV